MPGNWTTQTLGQIGADDPDGELLLLLHGKNVYNDRIYCYIRIAREIYNEFNEKINAGESIDLRQFGTVLAAGRGAPAADAQRDLIRELSVTPVKKEP